MGGGLPADDRDERERAAAKAWEVPRCHHGIDFPVVAGMSSHRKNSKAI
jgi:hypothetical protein